VKALGKRSLTDAVMASLWHDHNDQNIFSKLYQALPAYAARRLWARLYFPQIAIASKSRSPEAMAFAIATLSAQGAGSGCGIFYISGGIDPGRS